jgi:hypothetical protein
LKPCPGNIDKLAKKGDPPTCAVLPLCVANPGLPADECFKGASFVQLENHHKHKHHHKHHHKHREDDNSTNTDNRDNQSEDSATEAEPALPVCNGSNGVAGVDCLKPKPAKKKSLAQQPYGRLAQMRDGNDADGNEGSARDN